LKKNLPSISVSTADRYMRCYGNRDYLLKLRVSDLTEAYKAMNAPPPPTPVTNLVSETPMKEAKHGSNSSLAVPEADRPAVLAQAAANGPVTAKSVAATAPAFVPPKPEFDEIGIRIPGDALPFWHRRDEVQKLLTDLSRVKCAVEKAKLEGDPMFGKVSNGVLDPLTLAYTQISEAKPFAVCTECMGSFSVQPNGGCGMCGSKGLISKWQWDTHSRKEVKEMRLKLIAKERGAA